MLFHAVTMGICLNINRDVFIVEAVIFKEIDSVTSSIFIERLKPEEYYIEILK